MRGRRRYSRPRFQSSGKLWIRLFFYVLLLVIVLVGMGLFSKGAARCFTRMTG